LGCTPSQNGDDLKGTWRFALNLGEEELPFKAEIKEENGELRFYVVNGDERIRADEFKFEEDSLYIRLPIFNTALIGKYDGENVIGVFRDYSRKGEYRIPFVATKGDDSRFPIGNGAPSDVNGKWKVEFSPGSDNEYLAMGKFEQRGNQAYGTFLTTTGDYRYLEGNVVGDSLYLSCFDGAHAFLFKARINGDAMDGNFWSGNHWQENWTGVRSADYELPDPTSLTFLNPGYSKVDFSFENMDGQIVRLSDESYKEKVVIVQLMGSWCPNCKDETAYLVSLHKKFHEQGLEIVALAFEKSENKETNLSSLNRMKDHFQVPYEILLAGRASKTEAAQKLPMLNHVLSFPTTIFIDRNGEVRRIHTGFSGPGTGEYYHEFVEETDKFVTQLLIE
jgi:thiol-disulfide isomerase/thioredoxin